MPLNHEIKQTVQFPELTAVPKEQSENALFDVLRKLTHFCISSPNVSM